MLISALPNDWQSFFVERETNPATNAKMDGLANLFPEAKPISECVKTLIEEDNAVFMTIHPITKKVELGHHFSKFGGTRLQPEAFYSALVGFDDTANPVMIDPDSLFAGQTIRVPAWDSIKACNSKEQLMALSETAGGTAEIPIPATPFEDFFTRSVAVLPPLLACEWMDSDMRDPCELLLESLSIFSAYETKFAGAADMPEAGASLGHIIQILWGAAKNSMIQGVPMLVSQDPTFNAWSKSIHKEAIADNQVQISPSAGVQDVTMQAIATGMMINNKTLEKMHDQRAAVSEDKKKTFNKLHAVRVRMILNASSEDQSGVVPSAPCKDIQGFYECKTVGEAKIHLEHSLSTVYGCILNLSTGFVTALYSGSFVWDCPGKPNNWCGFQFAKPAPDTTSGVQEAMILTLKATEGKGWSDTDISRALVQGLVVASSVSELQHNLHNEQAAACYFFGEKSTLSKRLKQSLDHVRDHLQLYESLNALDKTFVAQVIFSHSVRIDNWFRECLTKEDRLHVDDSLLNFVEDHRLIINRRFTMDLPVSMSNFSKAAVEKSRPMDATPSPQDGKRQKRGNGRGNDAQPDDNAQPIRNIGVVNPKPRREWQLKEKESWRKVFTVRTKPRYAKGDCRWCNKYHTRGHCFPDCPNKANHIPSLDLTDADKPDDYSKYVKECRAGE
jgi:hypothetical protein